MTVLRTIAVELIGLFADDGRLALLIVVWVTICALAIPRLTIPAFLPPVLLFGGLGSISAFSVLKRPGPPR